MSGLQPDDTRVYSSSQPISEERMRALAAGLPRYSPKQLDAIVAERCRPLVEALESIAEFTPHDYRSPEQKARDALAALRAQSEAT